MTRSGGEARVSQATGGANDVLEVPVTGHYTVFGVTRKPVRFIEDGRSAKRETALVSVPFGREASLFIQTPAANLAETSETIALKLGLIYAPSGEFLSANDLLAQRIITPQSIDYEAIGGDGVVVCFNRWSPRFSAFRTLRGVPEPFYWAKDGDILCSDNLSCPISLLPTPQLEAEILPLHFLYRLACGDRSYIRDVRRLTWGSMLTWRAGVLGKKRVKDHRGFRREVRFNRMSEEATTFLYDQLGGVIAHYLEETARSGKGFGTLLSGGVDTSLIQLVINERCVPGEDERRSFSYQVKTEFFAPEADYATQASQTFGTKHALVAITPDSYAELLVDVIRIMGQPPVAESEPCALAIARYIQDQARDIGYLFAGHGGDALFGYTLAEIWWHLDGFRRFPGARLWLRFIEPFMRPINPHKAFVIRRVIALLPHINDVTSPDSPINEYRMFTDFDLTRRCFGEQAIQRALAHWQESEIEYLNSSSVLERCQIIDLLNDESLVASSCYQMFLTHGTVVIHPYDDERLVKATFAFDPRIGFYNKGVTKPIQKRILEQKSSSKVMNLPKLGSGFYPDLRGWMKQGSLQEMVHAIERPGFISNADFNRKIEEPDWFTWNMLLLDLFHKHVPRG